MTTEQRDLLAQWLSIAGDTHAPVRHTAPSEPGSPPHASAGQRGVWIMQQLMGAGNTGFVLRQTYHVQGRLDVQALQAALTDLVARHETLRTVFRAQGEALHQIVLDPAPVELTAGHPPAGAAPWRWVHDQIAADCLTVLDLAHGPLLRARLMGLGPGEWVLSLLIHHIAVDGWSVQLLHRDLSALYAARLDGATASLPVLRARFTDFAAREHERLNTGGFAADLAYWRERLSGAQPLPLPGAGPHRAVSAMSGRRVSVTVPPAASARVTHTARATGVTPFQVLLACLQLALSRWCGRSDVLVGVATAGRQDAEAQELAGPFAGVLPIRVDTAAHTGVAALLRASSERFLEACAHEVPFELILQHCLSSRERASTGLLTVAVGSHLGFTTPLTLPGARVRFLEPGELDVVQPLAVYLWSRPQGIAVAADHATGLLSRQDVEALLDHLVRIVSELPAPGS